MPERVEVLKIPCGRRESLAGLFLYHPLNPPSIGSNHNNTTTSGSTPETQSGQPSTAHTPGTPRAEGEGGGGSGSVRYGGGHSSSGSKRPDDLSRDVGRRKSLSKEEGTGRRSSSGGDSSPSCHGTRSNSAEGFTRKGQQHRSSQHRSPSSAVPENSVMIESARRLPCIVFSHGNSTDIGYMFGLYYRLAYR